MKDTHYYTATKLDVTKYIENGNTQFFQNFEKAQEYAKKKRSYMYPVFNSKSKHIGYAVPK